ncbi:DUF11 domain-containing protein [Methylocapsa sp. D3K7]|uniref:DUF11 domain-containing protein n=1 Tax=Methylocapsa sp. D3K7 TaxID=3041435 RepID=UPI00244ED173|nr:DUF11 domain-containing protein [Methylocapsa sp. D3K7]WGJ15796.1 DUF11 domain-containing protein [Methylocapsa sp. D3K7]
MPVQPISNLGNLVLTGTVNGGGDSVSLFDGTTLHAATGDNLVNLAANWQIAEFNVFGDTCGPPSQATFNSGSTVIPRTRITYGGTAAPTCVSTGFTGETNNLNFGPTAPTASLPGPAIIFEESSAGGSSACAATTPVGQSEADLAITKTAPSTVVAGTTLTYTINVSNLGPNNATNVVVTDPLPAGTTFKMSSISCSGSPVTCNLGTLANGLSMSFTITANVPSSFVTPAITNTASVTANETDPNPANNTSSASTLVTQSADLQLVKTCGPTPFALTGHPAFCDIQVSNLGVSDAQNAVLNDAIVSGVKFTVDAVSGAACAPATPIGPTTATTLACNLGTLVAGAVQTTHVVFTTKVFGTISDTATVTSTTPDPNSGNNSATGKVNFHSSGLRP